MGMSRPLGQGMARRDGETMRERRREDDDSILGFQGLSGKLQRRERKCSGDLASKRISEDPENVPRCALMGETRKMRVSTGKRLEVRCRLGTAISSHL